MQKTMSTNSSNFSSHSATRAVKAPQTNNSMPTPIEPPQGFSTPTVLPASTMPKYVPSSAPASGNASKIFSPLDEAPLVSVGMRPEVLKPPGEEDNFVRKRNSSDEDSLFIPGGGFNKAQGVTGMILQWCQARVKTYKGVKIDNFSASWNDGMAFCALIHNFYPDAFDFDQLDPKNRRYNFDLAFRMFNDKAGVAPLLDVEDMVMMKKPDWKCVFTYIQLIYQALG